MLRLLYNQLIICLAIRPGSYQSAISFANTCYSFSCKNTGLSFKWHTVCSGGRGTWPTAPENTLSVTNRTWPFISSASGPFLPFSAVQIFRVWQKHRVFKAPVRPEWIIAGRPVELFQIGLAMLTVYFWKSSPPFALTYLWWAVMKMQKHEGNEEINSQHTGEAVDEM